MAAPTSKDHLVRLANMREEIFAALQVRESQGEFDVNSKTIILMLKAILAIISYEVAAAEQSKRSSQ